MITKKLGKIVFGWNESALKGKGWWYVMGKDDSFARAASRKEASKLGLPKEQDKPPKDVGKQKYYYDINKQGKPIRKRIRTGSGYEEADITGRKGLMQLASERMMGGQGVMGSLGGAIGDKVMSKVTRIKRAFDPMNLLNKIPGVGKLAATAYGMKRGRSAEDISYFTGVHAPPEMEKNEPDETTSPVGGGGEVSKGKASKMDKSATSILNKIYKLLSDKFEEDKKLRETESNFNEEQQAEAEKRNKELLDALLKGKKDKDGKKVEKKQEDGLMYKLGFMLGKLFNFMKSGIMNAFKTIGPLLMRAIGPLMPILGQVALIGAAIYGASKLIDKAYEFFTGKDSDFYNKTFDPQSTPEDMQKKLKSEKLAGTIDETSGMGKAKARTMADYEKQLKETGKVKNVLGQDITEQAKKELGDYKATKQFKETDPYQQYKREVEGKDFKGKKKPTFEEWKAQKGITATGQTATKVPEQMTEQKQSYEMIGGQPVIAGQPLNETQMAAAKMSMDSGNKLLPETQKSYDLAKQIGAQPSELGQRVNAATMENQNLVGPVSQAGAPVIVNKTTNVVNNGGVSGGGGSGSIRNDEPVLTRLQYQSVRPV